MRSAACRPRRGRSPAAQACSAGCARRENQTSSAKPSARPGRPRAGRIRRSRRLFSGVGGVGAGGPALGALPAHPRPRQRPPDRLLPQDGRAQPVLVRDPRQEGERPGAPEPAEGARRLVRERAQPPEPGLAQGRGGALGARRAGAQGRQAAGVERAGGVAHGPHRAAQAVRDRPRATPRRARQQDLGTPHRERACRTQGGSKSVALRAVQLTDEDRWTHPDQVRSTPPRTRAPAETHWAMLGLADCPHRPALGGAGRGDAPPGSSFGEPGSASGNGCSRRRRRAAWDQGARRRRGAGTRGRLRNRSRLFSGSGVLGSGLT